MSIVACPQCGKRISSLAPICDHCGHKSGETSEEDLYRFRERKFRTQLYRLNMATYTIMAVVLLAFGWYWMSTNAFQAPARSIGPYLLVGASAVAYVVVRGLQFRVKSRRKAHRRGE